MDVVVGVFGNNERLAAARCDGPSEEVSRDTRERAMERRRAAGKRDGGRVVRNKKR